MGGMELRRMSGWKTAEFRVFNVFPSFLPSFSSQQPKTSLDKLSL